jgi:hypothetical protein
VSCPRGSGLAPACSSFGGVTATFLLALSGVGARVGALDTGAIRVSSNSDVDIYAIGAHN